jgi:glycosyltransferase involved in cell wall biosynthesis
MRILLWTSSYPPVLGGLQTVVHALAVEFLKAGHEVRVITNRYPRSLPSKEVIDGVPVYRWLFLTPSMDDLRRKRLDLFLASFFVYPAVFFSIRRFFRNYRPDVVNVHFPDAQIPLVLKIRDERDFRLVVSMHGDEVERWFQTPQRGNRDHLLNRPRLKEPPRVRELSRILRRADRVTVCSDYLLGKVSELEPAIIGKEKTIHNGVDLDRFRDRTPYAYRRRYIFSYGRLTYKKGFDMLLEAFAKVLQCVPDVDLILAGEGEENAALREQARHLNIEAHVFFYGRGTQEDIVRLLNGCELVVMPSRSDAFGIVALETMAAGKPLLATRVGGVPEFAGGAGNVLVEPSAEALFEAMKVWLYRQDALKELSEKNRQYAANYSWAVMMEKYLQLLKG